MYPAVLTIVLVGMVLGVGLYVLSTLHTSVATDYTGTQNDFNTTTGTTVLTDAALTEFAITDTPILINSTDGNTFTNFTCTAAGTCTWGTDIVAIANDDLFNISYTFNYDSTNSPEESITTTVTGLATFADWIAIIVVVIAAAIVLGVVLSSFGKDRNSI